MLWLWVVCGLAMDGCTCSGIYPPAAALAPVISTSEAHGPLARLALHASGGGFPYRGPDSGVVRLPAPSPPTAYTANADHRLSTTVTGYVIRPNDTEPKHTTAMFQVKRPVIQKQFYETEERVGARPIGTAVVDLGRQIPKNFVPLIAPVSPEWHQAVTGYRSAYSYPVSSYPLVSYYHPFHVPVQAYPPVFILDPQGVVQIPQQTPVYPQQPIDPPRPPQQFPVYPQRPVLAPRPPQQTPAYPQPPQTPAPQPGQSNPVPKPPSLSTGNEEYDYSDTVVIDNPDFERLANRKGQPKIQTEFLSKSSQTGDKQCDEDKKAQRVLEEFKNRQILRQFGIKQSQFLRGVEPSQIQTLEELEGLGQRSGFEDASAKSSATEKYSSSSNQDEPVSLYSTASERQIVNPKSITIATKGQIAYVRKSPADGRSNNNQQILIELLSDDEEASVADGVVRGRLISVTPVPDGEGSAERASSRRALVNSEPAPAQLTHLVRPTLAASVVYRR